MYYQHIGEKNNFCLQSIRIISSSQYKYKPSTSCLFFSKNHNKFCSVIWGVIVEKTQSFYDFFFVHHQKPNTHKRPPTSTYFTGHQNFFVATHLMRTNLPRLMLSHSFFVTTMRAERSFFECRRK